MPFSLEQFIQVFVDWNTAIWPAQLVVYALGVAAVALAFKPVPRGSAFIVAVLALIWLVNGAGYHLWQFSRINPAAYGFGALFIVQAVLFAYAGSRGRLHFAVASGPVDAVGLVFVAYALVIYPLLGMMFGHAYPASPLFGVAPCPTTIFTIGMLLLANRRVPVYLPVIPFAWSLIGGSAAIVLNVPEDWGLLVAGILGTPLIYLKNRRLAAVSAAG
jgi:hypothetical protein